MQRFTSYILMLLGTLIISKSNAQISIDTSLTPEQNFELNCDPFLRYGTYIPQNLEECIVVLLHEPKSILDTFKIQTEIDAERFGFNFENKRLRKSWYLDIHSNLSIFFYKNEIYHPKTMESIILVAFHRYLNNKKYNLDSLCTIYREIYASEEKEYFKLLKKNYKEELKNRKNNKKIRKKEKAVLKKREKNEIKLNEKRLTKINNKKEKYFKDNPDTSTENQEKM